MARRGKKKATVAIGHTVLVIGRCPGAVSSSPERGQARESSPTGQLQHRTAWQVPLPAFRFPAKQPSYLGTNLTAAFGSRRSPLRK